VFVLDGESQGTEPDVSVGDNTAESASLKGSVSKDS
jgi:hypothetical protein